MEINRDNKLAKSKTTEILEEIRFLLKSSITSNIYVYFKELADAKRFLEYNRDNICCNEEVTNIDDLFRWTLTDNEKSTKKNITFKINDNIFNFYIVIDLKKIYVGEKDICVVATFAYFN